MNDTQVTPSRLRIAVASALLALPLAARAGTGHADYISSNPNPSNTTDGLNVNAYLGATRFYANGLTGSSAVVANVEAGHVWNGHETLGHVTTLVTGPGAKGEFDRHATWVAMILAGRPTTSGGEYQRGVAYGATAWSGAIATTWTGNPYTLGFDYSVASFADVYRRVLITGVDGRTADVTNSSWSDGSDLEAARYGDYSRAVDAIALRSGKTMVFTAGNRGPSANTVGAPGSGFNVITVGSLGSDLTVPPYDTATSFSARGAQAIFIPSVRNADYFNPTHGTTVSGARAAVDISAPGQNLVSAFYGGATGGNAGGVSTGGTTDYSASVTGTSFAAPAVSGGATLMADAARQRLGEATRALDGRVMKANLLNSADKIANWTNGQSVAADNVIRTTQALDYASGAGRLNLNRAYDQLLAGTTDVPGTGGGIVAPVGWDYGVVAQDTPNDYRILTPLLGGSNLTVTLDWFVDRAIDLQTNATLESSFDNLDLQVWSTDLAGAAATLVAESVTQYNEVEHLSFALPESGGYLLRVLWAGEVWDLVNDANTTTFGLAWSATVVPEPTMASAVIVLSALMCCSRRRCCHPVGA